MNGAATSPDSHVLAYAGAQVKKGLDVAKKLGAENFGRRDQDATHCTLYTVFSTFPMERCYSLKHFSSFQYFGAAGRASTPFSTLT